MEPGGRLPARSVGPPRPGDAHTLSAAVYVQNGWTKDGRLTKEGSLAIFRKTWQNAPAAAWRGLWQLRQDVLIEWRWLTESGQLLSGTDDGRLPLANSRHHEDNRSPGIKYADGTGRATSITNRVGSHCRAGDVVLCAARLPRGAPVCAAGWAAPGRDWRWVRHLSSCGRRPQPCPAMDTN